MPAPIVVNPLFERTRIAYFSMEIALRSDVHTYSGGLGILAGDAAQTCADLELPIIFVTLVSRSGYLKQEIDSTGRQIDHPDPWNPAATGVPLDAMIAVPIEGREVWIRPWLDWFRCPTGGECPILFLDTDLGQNQAEDRTITDRLYGGDSAYRLKQEIVLGIGGLRLLQALGFRINRYHMNEGHAALLALQLLRQYRRPADEVRPGESAYDPAEVREMCVFTTHTPVDAGHDRFDYAMVERVLEDPIEPQELRLLAGADSLNMTLLALNLSGYINGVARRHAETTRQTYPGYRVHAITNGVHVGRWTQPAMARLFDSHYPHWVQEPATLMHVDELDNDPVWSAHQEGKQTLLQLISARSGVAMRPDVPLIGFARRMTGYKRPELLFTDIDRLMMIAQARPLQIVLAGKAHPADDDGKRIIERLHVVIEKLAGKVPIAFLADYDMALAGAMVGGTDVWLNTPLPPYEASGTSGMKAALNGALNLSVVDGWWSEAWIEGVTGWAIGDSQETASGDGHYADLLYRKLQDIVLPLYYGDRPRWIWMMKQGMSKIGSYFNTDRMMRRYATEAYLR